jgi:hypothetical protein
MRDRILILWILSCFHTFGQTTVFEEDFNTSTGSSYSVSNDFIGKSNLWSMQRSGDDWGARIDGGILDLTNNASTNTNANGNVFAYIPTDSIKAPFTKRLCALPGKIEWKFNMQQIRAGPSGFGSNTYGVAMVLASNSNEILATGFKSYAVVLGNSGTPKPVRLVKIENSSITNIIISNTTGLDDFGNEHLSIAVTFDPYTFEWEMFLRNDGTAFANPDTGNLTSQGKAIDKSLVADTMNYLGCYWQGSTAANQNAKFDNITVKVINQSNTEISAIGLSGIYRQHFNSLMHTGSGMVWKDDSTLTGWFASRNEYNTGTGSSFGGSLYSYGSANDPERALGSLASATTGNIHYGVKLHNQTGVTVNAVYLKYKGEQWRNSGEHSAHQLEFYYSTSFTNLTTGTYHNIPSLNFITPERGGTAGLLNGNAKEYSRTIAGVFPVSLAEGDSIMIRWSDLDETGLDHGYGIDDLEIVFYSSIPVTLPELAGNFDVFAALNSVIVNTDTFVANHLLSIDSGQFDLNGKHAKLNGLLTIESGVFSGTENSSLHIAGDTDRIYLPEMVLGNLTIERSNGVVQTGNLTVFDSLKLNTGNLNIGPNRLIMHGQFIGDGLIEGNDTAVLQISGNSIVGAGTVSFKQGYNKLKSLIVNREGVAGTNASLVFGTDIEVVDTLALTKGIVQLDTNNLFFSGNNLFGGNSESYVRTNSTGTFQCYGGQDILIPIGINPFLPLVVDCNICDSIIISSRVEEGVTDALNSPVTSNVVNTTWTISTDDTLSNVGIAFQWPESLEMSNFDRSKAFTSKRYDYNSPWLTNAVSGASGSNPYIISDTFSFSGNQSVLFAIADNTSLLPISLAYFTVVEKDHRAILKWATYTETNNSHFELYRSLDRKTFDFIAKIPGMGNSYVLTNYEYHEMLSDFHTRDIFYQLCQFDFNGTKTCLEIIALKSNQKRIHSGIQVFKNPEGQITVKRSSEYTYAQNFKIKLLTACGNTIEIFEFKRHENEINIESNHLAAGFYLIGNDEVGYVKWIQVGHSN